MLCAQLSFSHKAIYHIGGLTINNNEFLKSVVNSQQIYEYGICDYDKIGALLPCKNSHRIPLNAASIITIAVPYYTGEVSFSNLCRYARVPDYHKVVMHILNKIISDINVKIPGTYEAFCDISAIPEKTCAVLSGIGFLGKNGLVINKNLGSYFVIGEIVTDISFSPTPPCDAKCGDCHACVNACAAQILGDNNINYDHCLSAITQKKGELTPTEVNLIHKNKLAWGCDRCQEVCPFNKAIKPTNIEDFYSDVQAVLTPENLQSLRKTRAFGYRSATILRRNLDCLII